MGSESNGLAPELRHAAAERLGIVALVYAVSYTGGRQATTRARSIFSSTSPGV